MITIRAGLCRKYAKGETIMKIPRKLGTLLLAIWLILIGLSGFVSLGDLTRILDVIAIAAGLALLFSR